VVPAWDNFYNILGRHCQFLECSAKPGQEFKQYDKRPEKQNHPHKKAFLTARGSCIKCDSTDYNLGPCPSFVALPHEKRHAWVRQAALCLNCLQKAHIAADCPSKFHCRTCRGLHHSSLHRRSETKEISQPNVEQTNRQTSNLVVPHK